MSSSGETITKQFSYSFLDYKNSLILSYRTDITQSVREEQEINERLRTAVNVTQKANEAKTQFLSRISHDIRTPIGAILNLTDFAKKDMGNSQNLSADLDKIATSGRFLLSLINDVLDISKIDSDKIELNEEPYSFIDYVKEIKNIIAPMCKEKNILYEIIMQNDGAEVVMMDKIRINQITLNLLSNAVKYTAPGGRVTFCVSAFAGKTREAEEGGASFADIKISVTDTGIGMSKSFQGVMFDDFSQEEDNPLRSKEIQGTGLGLAIVKRLVDLMGGRISVKSVLGKGSSISVTLRGKIVQKENASSDTRREIDVENQDKIEGTVLLAEDNEINAAIACRIFEEIGVSVELASNGEEEVKMFASSPEGKYLAAFRPDALTVPIIAMTANAYPEAARKARESGMSDFTTKPLDSKKLKKILRSYSEKRLSAR